MENKVENKKDALADEVMENVAGGAEEVVRVTWYCPKCKKDITIEAPKSQIEAVKSLHRFADGQISDDTGYFN